MIVYVARNKLNGKQYVGKTIVSLSHARQRHHQRAKFIWKYGVFSRFYTALRKYGTDAFEWSVVYHGTSDADIQRKERELIELWQTMDPDVGYNMTPGGDGGAGKTLSPQHKAKLKAAFSREGNPQFGKTGALHPAFGHRHTAETKSRIAQAHKGRVVSEATRQKLSQTRTSMYAAQKAARLERERLAKLLKAEAFRQRVEAGEFKGEGAGASKVTNEERAEICRRRAAGESYASIASDFPVGLTGVRAICADWGPLNGFPFGKIVAKRGSKLSDETRREICRSHRQGVIYRDLAARYGVSETTIHSVVRAWGATNGF